MGLLRTSFAIWPVDSGIGILRAQRPLHSNRGATADVTPSGHRSWSKPSAALLGKRVHDVKEEPGGKHGCDKRSEQSQEGQEQRRTSEGRAKLGGKDYERALAKLHGELVKLQLWVIAKGLKVVVVFEGRDGAGKGGVIKAITERVSPRVYRVVALPAPTEREKSQMYVQRYMRHMPAAGEIVIFDRSWYNRAGVERVMEFCSMDAG